MGRAHADGSNEFDDWKTYFEIPHWMHLSYVSYDEHTDILPFQDTASNAHYGKTALKQPLLFSR